MTCLSNVRQFAFATLMYIQDYDQTLPMAIRGEPDGSDWWSLMELIEPYVKNKQIRFCPSNPSGNRLLASSPYQYPGPLASLVDSDLQLIGGRGTDKLIFLNANRDDLLHGCADVPAGQLISRHVVDHHRAVN